VLGVLSFVVIVMVLGMRLALREMSQLGHATRIPMFWPFLSLPVGSLLILLQLLYLIKLLAKRETPPLGF
jgi:TRAP-type C4-dicarboxylate transport system permease small subunit